MFSAPCDFVSTAPYSYKFGPSSGTALLTMTVADYSRQALLRQCCCVEVRESSSGKNAFFPTMYLLHLHLGFRVASGFILFSRLTHLRMPYAVSVRQVSGLPPASFRSRLAADTLALGYVLGATPCTRDFHPLERAHAERTVRKPRAFKRGLFSVHNIADSCRNGAFVLALEHKLLTDHDIIVFQFPLYWGSRCRGFSNSGLTTCSPTALPTARATRR